MWSVADVLFGGLLPVPSKTGADQPKLPGVRCRVYAGWFPRTGVGVLFPAMPDEQLGWAARSLRGLVVTEPPWMVDLPRIGPGLGFVVAR